MTKRTSLYLNPPLREALEGAGSISGRLGQVCDRYLEICDRANIEGRFTVAELRAVRESCAGLVFAPAPLITGAVASAFAASGEPEFGSPDWTLLAKLRALTYWEQVALVEIIERKQP